MSFHDTGAIVAAACLAHDIGNPPFGHSGEAAIGAWFTEGMGSTYASAMSEVCFEDLCRFEGNANGFKILSGLRVTFPTLATFTKYPKESLPVYQNPLASQKKFGFFQEQKEVYKEVAKALHIPMEGSKDGGEFRRHPFVYLVEAADDICYQIIDFEDGLRLGWIPFHLAEELLIPIAGDAFYENNYKQLSGTEEKAGYLRAVAINNLIKEAANHFIEQEAAILQGSFNQSLLSLSGLNPLLKEVKKISLQKVYKARQVVEIEAAGFEVIGGLLSYFAPALLASAQGKAGRHQQKVLELLPAHLVRPKTHTYETLLAVCCYVASLTDKHAITLFRRMKGIELPG